MEPKLSSSLRKYLVNGIKGMEIILCSPAFEINAVINMKMNKDGIIIEKQIFMPLITPCFTIFEKTIMHPYRIEQIIAKITLMYNHPLLVCINKSIRSSIKYSYAKTCSNIIAGLIICIRREIKCIIKLRLSFILEVTYA